MTNIPDKLDHITTKIQQLIAENARLTQENTNLTEENNRLKFRLEEKAQNTPQIAPVGNKSATIDVAQLKEKIDKYTVEVEECIEYLNND